MSADLAIDVESVVRFQSAARRALDLIEDQRRTMTYAGVAAGSYTRTVGGQLCDQAHAALVGEVGELLGVAGDLCGGLADLAAEVIDAYQRTDEVNAAAIADGGPLPERARRDEV